MQSKCEINIGESCERENKKRYIEGARRTTCTVVSHTYAYIYIYAATKKIPYLVVYTSSICIIVNKRYEAYDNVICYTCDLKKMKTKRRKGNYKKTKMNTLYITIQRRSKTKQRINASETSREPSM